jgi:hypothetical protein
MIKFIEDNHLRQVINEVKKEKESFYTKPWFVGGMIVSTVVFFPFVLMALI